MNTDSGLRERKKAKTREQIIEATVTLCLRHGFKKTTIQQIVDSVDVSRRTFFRYFRTKEDVVMERIGAFCDEVQVELRSRPKEESIWDSLVAALTCFISRSALNAHGMLSLHRMMMDNASLRARKFELPMSWETAMIPEVRKRMGSGREQEMRARVLVSAAIASASLSFDLWHESGGKGSLQGIAKKAFALSKPTSN